MSDTVSTLGVRKDHALRAKRWLFNRGVLAFYRAADKSLNVAVTKHGRGSTYSIMERALAETQPRSRNTGA